jgi:ketosteroid isomerase-like protein
VSDPGLRGHAYAVDCKLRAVSGLGTLLRSTYAERSNTHRRLDMNKLIAPILFTCAWIGPVFAAAPQPSNDPADVSAVKQLEQDMGDAMVRVDVAKLSEIYADDFATISAGKIVTKQDLLQDFSSLHDKLESFENGPIDVQVFGNVAVAYGSVSEKRIQDGKDRSGNFVWMDVLEKRAGKWLVVRSTGAKLK